MKLIFYILAFMGGVFLAVQAGFNAQITRSTKQPLIAVVATAITSGVLGMILLRIQGSHSNIKVSFPWYLWPLGGIFSLLGLSAYFYTIPKIGISKMIAFGLMGQLLFSVIASHFGWFNLPETPINTRKIVGILSLLLAVILLNYQK